MSSRPFTPWRAQLRRANFLIFVAPLLIAALAYALQRDYMALASMCALSMLYGLRLRASVQARRYGQAIETAYSSRAVDQLSSLGLKVEAGRMTAAGDIDLIVRHGPRSATVEIKSFHYWRSRWRDRARQSAARVQARRQRAIVGADLAIIWLPKAWPTWLTRVLNTLLPERNPIVVIGPVRKLSRELKRQLG